MWQAVTAVFGHQVEVRGCFFHLTQNTWRKIQSLGLATLYKDDDEAEQFCGMIDALAFVPESNLHEGSYVTVKFRTTDKCNGFIIFFILFIVCIKEI